MPSRIYGRASFFSQEFEKGNREMNFQLSFSIQIISIHKKGESISVFSFNFFSLLNS